MTDLFHETCPCCGQPIAPKQQQAAFAAFWDAVPHKIGKAAAEKAWRKLTPQDRVSARDNARAFYMWFSKTYPTASPVHPSTYLNGRRWEDEPIRPRTASTGAMDSLRLALQSKNPAVREHAEQVMKRMGDA